MTESLLFYAEAHPSLGCQVSTNMLRYFLSWINKLMSPWGSKLLNQSVNIY